MIDCIIVVLDGGGAIPPRDGDCWKVQIVVGQMILFWLPKDTHTHAYALSDAHPLT